MEENNNYFNLGKIRNDSGSCYLTDNIKFVANIEESEIPLEEIPDKYVFHCDETDSYFVVYTTPGTIYLHLELEDMIKYESRPFTPNKLSGILQYLHSTHIS